LTLLSDKLIEGVFLNEIKNRFLCKVCINKEVYECYIPSSSRLENYINLKNKKVLLTINKGKDTRTKYSIFAVKHRNKYIILNLHYANKLFELKLNEGQYEEYCKPGTCKREVSIEGYRADLLYEGAEKTIIENKAIISVNNETLFHGAHAPRGINQLEKLNILLGKGYKVNYNLIALSPFVKIIKLNPILSEFNENFLRCIRNGMQVYGYCLYLSDGDMRIESKKIKVVIE
jgi:DNA-binding sugar fermentation-stimulating protein